MRTPLIALLALTAALVGCDPAGPGVTGKITLETNVDATKFKTLEVRAQPETSTFDPGNPTFAADKDWIGAGGGELATVKFPFEYTIGVALGTASQKDWRVFAWLSESNHDEAGDAPKSGEPFGTTPFQLGKCGALIDDFCGTTSGVDFSIGQFAP